MLGWGVDTIGIGAGTDIIISNKNDDIPGNFILWGYFITWVILKIFQNISPNFKMVCNLGDFGRWVAPVIFMRIWPPATQLAR